MNEPVRRKTRADIEAALRQLVIEVVGLPADATITVDTLLGNGYGFNKGGGTPEHNLYAIDHVEIICAAEATQGVSISDAAGKRIETFGQLVEEVARLSGITEEQPE